MNIRKRVIVSAAALALAGGAVGGGAAMAAGSQGRTAAVPAARHAAPVHVQSAKVGNIGRGSKNHHGVWCVQRGINDWHKRTHGTRPLREDGDFGAKTHTWVLAFQKASHLKRDGVVGKKTGNSVLANLGGEPKQRAYCYKYVPSTRH